MPSVDTMSAVGSPEDFTVAIAMDPAEKAANARARKLAHLDDAFNLNGPGTSAVDPTDVFFLAGSSSADAPATGMCVFFVPQQRTDRRFISLLSHVTAHRQIPTRRVRW